MAFLIYYVGLTKWFNDIVDWIDVKVFHNDFKEVKEFYYKNRVRVKNNINALADERSKEIYKALINYRRTHNRKFMQGIVDCAKDMYFDKDIVKWNKNETFCECGAYNGDTLKIISELMLKNKIVNWKAIAFECEDRNYELLVNRIEKDVSLRGRILTYKLATWEKKAILNFDSGMEQSSRMSDKGRSLVNADSVDNVLSVLKNHEQMSKSVANKVHKHRVRDISFIIMDVEGAEMPGIRGAVKTIMKDRIYHSDADMVDIIEYIHKNWPFYKLYVRHYTWLYTETVLYAIP